MGGWYYRWVGVLKAQEAKMLVGTVFTTVFMLADSSKDSSKDSSTGGMDADRCRCCGEPGV